MSIKCIRFDSINIITGKGDPAEEDDRRAAPEVRTGAAGRDAAVRAPHDHLLQPAAASGTLFSVVMTHEIHGSDVKRIR